MREPAEVHLTWATLGDVPPGETWLTGAETRVYGGLRVSRRATDWRLGRWVAKGAVAAALHPRAPEPSVVEVLPGPGGAPTVRLLDDAAVEEPGGAVEEAGGEDAGPGSVTVSLSHCGGTGFAAAAPTVLRLGCDVEAIEARSEAFVSDYFTEDEERWIRSAELHRDLRANLLWSAKESALKALGEGLRLDTRAVEVEAVARRGRDPEAWRALAVAVPDGRTFPGLWRVRDGRVWTVVAERPFRLA